MTARTFCFFFSLVVSTLANQLVICQVKHLKHGSYNMKLGDNHFVAIVGVWFELES